MSELVSVVIPTIGRESLQNTVQTVMDQTYPEIEILVVRDSARRGAPWARNAGAKRAGGGYLMFVDDDDVLEPRAVAALLQALRLNRSAAYAYGWFVTGGKIQGRVSFNAARLKQRNYISRALIRKPSFPGFDEKLPRWQDWELYLRMLSRGQHGVFVNEKILTEPGPNGISLDNGARRRAYQILRKRYGIAAWSGL